MASKATDSDGGSLTPSEQSDAEERSEHDSDYETEEEEEDKNQGSESSNVVWTGFGKKTPVVIFKVEGVTHKRPDLKTIGERYHLAFKFGTTECKIVRNILSSHGFHEVHPNSADFNLLWTNAHLKPFTLRSMTEFQKINHFPRSYELTRKDRLYKNIQRMQQIRGHRHFDFIPNSFVLPGEYQDFCSAFLREKGHWIVKPVASSRGRGVFLINHPDQIPLDENLIVCKYLGNPLLIDGFKFDVRLYVAVTSYDPLVIYLFEEGLTRFATVKYEKSNKHIRNQCMHLTNYSVNKKSQDYVRNDDPDVEDYGNKWSLGAMLRYLRSQGKDTAALMMRIEDVLIKTIISVELPVATACKMFMPYRGNCFELYGFDILVDDNLKPWVLEVNLSPSLACDSPLDLKIKANMLCDLFSLTGIVCHDPMIRNMQQSRRNQEIASKMAARAKSARARPATAAVRQRPMSAGPSNSTGSLKEKGGNKNLAGLNSEEIKILRRAKEEDHRKGGWVKIFPTADSWEIYSPFLQFNTTHNLTLHQRLFPERHKGVVGKLATTGVTSIGARSRTGYLQITGSNSAKGENEQQRHVEAYAHAVIRTRQYERRLGQKRKRPRNKKKSRITNKKETKPKLVQGVADDMEEDQDRQSDEEMTTNQRGDTAESQTMVKEAEKVIPLEVAVTQQVQDDPAVTEVKVEEKPSVCSPHVEEDKEKEEAELQPVEREPETDQEPEIKYNVVELLTKGGSLSKVQARSAFAMYLVRVQQRLINDSGALSQEDVEALNEQMDLVLRFLKRAAVNLQQSFKVIVPSRKLPLSDRRRILAKQLGDFVHIYNKETEQLRSRKMIDRRHLRRSESVEGLNESKFEKFVNTACEAELEEVLTTYTKLNKSASIFLGSNSKTSVDSHQSTLVGASAVRSDSSLVKRRDTGDTHEGITNWEEVPRVRSTSNTDIRYESGGSHSLPRPASAHHHPPSSYNNAVTIYSQKLSRPRSAIVANQKTGSRPTYARPSSAANQSRPATSSYTTSEPTVDTYNEQAIHEALQKLAIRQQNRQYSALNGTSALGSELPARPSRQISTANGSRPGSASLSYSRQRTDSLHNTDSTGISTQIRYQERSEDSKQSTVQPLQRYTTMDEILIHSRPSSASGFNRATKESNMTSSKSSGKPMQTNVNLQNANATFNSFIDDTHSQWQTDLMNAYSQVTGVQPHNYHSASTGSRQYRLAQQQQAMKQQRLMEQSKALLEQSKAKHQAMVAQAHAAQRTLNFTHPAEIQTGKQTFTPKPPLQPAGGKKLTPAHRLARTSAANDEGNLNFNFYNSLKYDIHTGQTQPRGGDGW